MEQGLIALQGPKAATVLQSLVNFDLQTLKFMYSVKTEVLGNRIRITRCGYTGEDGFEISVSAKDVINLVEKILENPDVKLAGLGARDSLRQVINIKYYTLKYTLIVRKNASEIIRTRLKKKIFVDK